MSLSAPKNYLTNSQSTRIHRKPKKDEKLLAIDECKKLYQKFYAYPSSSLLNQLNENYFKLFLDHLTYKDISIISDLLSKYYFFQQIEVYITDPNKTEPTTTRKRYRPPILTEEEKNKIEKEKKLKQQSIKKMIHKIIIGISKNISISKSIIALSLNKIDLTKKYCEYLSKAIKNNKSLQSISITNSNIVLNSYELLLESFLNHKLISYIDLSNNNFGDKYGKMISRIIVRQSQRRDQVVWYYGLRNEIPLSNDYKKGLILINLNGNNLGKDSAECISSALYSDQYIRAVYLNNNKFDNSSCKKFIYMMRKNLSILTIDLRGNPGYDNSIHPRLVMKMSKNIRYLYQQYKKGEYSEKEFENFKLFIDVTFFDVDIPQNVVEFYNNNLPETSEENENKENNERNIKTEIERNKIIDSIKEEMVEDEIDSKANTYNNFKTNKSVNIFEENKKLYDENLRLKQQIIELKAKNLQKHLGRNDNNNKNNESNNNESKESKSDIDKDYHRVESLINELNELMNKIEKKKSKKKLIDKDNNNINNINQNTKNEDNIIKKDETIPRPSQEIKEIISEVKEEINESEKNLIKSGNEDNKDLVNIKTPSNNSNNDSSNNNIIKHEEEKNNKEKEVKNDLGLPYQNAEPTEVKDKESDASGFVDENGNVYNFDDLTDEDKMIILQQKLIFQELQKEAEARGEQFDPQKYIEFLEKQAMEEEEEDLKEKESSNKLNKSF